MAEQRPRTNSEWLRQAEGEDFWLTATDEDHREATGRALVSIAVSLRRIESHLARIAQDRRTGR